MERRKIALITGGGTGIGRASARKLAEEGYDIAIVYHTSADSAVKLQKELEDKGAKCWLFSADVSEEAQCTRLFEEVQGRVGRLDAFVGCAGTTKYIRFSDLDAVHEDVWEKLMRVNVFGSFYCAREAAKLMTDGGAIVLIASLAGQRPSGSSIPYAASKAALLHMSKCLAMALAPRIRVNTISPGIVTHTDWHREDKNWSHEAGDAKESVSIPLGYVTEPEEVADAVVFMVTERSSNITGTDLLVDGGRGAVHNGQIY